MANYMGRSTSGRLPPTGRKNSWELYVERKMIVRRRLVVYVLFVAGIFDGDGVAADGVGVVPLTRVCHVMTRLQNTLTYPLI